MAKSTPHSALTDLGFKLAEEKNLGGTRAGEVTERRYTKNTGVLGGGNMVRPITHTITVHEYGGKPKEPDVHYELTQGGQSYADGYYDTLRRHKKNWRGGVEDPIGDVITHHGRVARDLERRGSPEINDVDAGNVRTLNPQQPYHMTPGWGTDDPHMKGTRWIVPGPDMESARMVHLNAAEDQPLDPQVYRRLTGGAKGRPTFEYYGRIAPGDPDTDVYHTSHEDPEDPYMRYGFTVRHMPGATSSPVLDHTGEVDPLLPKPLVFSYNMTHYPTDMGDDAVGEFRDVTGERYPVANFTDVGPLIERHHNMLRSVGLMDMPPREPRPAWHFTAALARKCPECRGTDVDFIQEYDKDANGSHSIPTNRISGQCNDCFAEFSPQEIPSPDSASWSPSMERESRLVRRADEFDNIVNGSGFAGPCWTCGKATYNYPEGTSFRDNKSYPMTAEEETGGEMHGPDINMCGTCSQDHGAIETARGHGSHGQGRLWSYKEPDHDDWENGDDAFSHEAKNKARRLMEQADDDLRP